VVVVMMAGFVLVVVMVIMMMGVIVLMIVSMGRIHGGCILGRFRRNYIDFGSGDSAAQHFAHFDARAYVERRGCFLEEREGDARINKRAEQHVAADAGKTLQIAYSHCVLILNGDASTFTLRAAAG
jgi:hypothetical protein